MQQGKYKCIDLEVDNVARTKISIMEEVHKIVFNSSDNALGFDGFKVFFSVFFGILFFCTVVLLRNLFHKPT